MFVSNHRQLNSSKTDDSQREFNGESIKQFWEQLWSSDVYHNKDAE